MAGGRQRAARRKAKAKAMREAIVSANLSQPKPEASAALVRSKGGSLSVIRGPATSSEAETRLLSRTHTGFRSPLHEGGKVKVIASRGFHLGRPEAKGFVKPNGVEPKPLYPTGVTDKRYSKLNAYQAHERETARERKRQEAVEAAWKLAMARKRQGKG